MVNTQNEMNALQNDEYLLSSNDNTSDMDIKNNDTLSDDEFMIIYFAMNIMMIHRDEL